MTTPSSQPAGAGETNDDKEIEDGNAIPIHCDGCDPAFSCFWRGHDCRHPEEIPMMLAANATLRAELAAAKAECVALREALKGQP